MIVCRLLGAYDFKHLRPSFARRRYKLHAHEGRGGIEAHATSQEQQEEA